MPRLVGKLIQRRRNAKHLTQPQLAKKLGTSREHISRWENDHGGPGEKHQRGLAKHLGGQPDDYARTKRPAAEARLEARLKRVERQVDALEAVVATVKQQLSKAGLIPG